MNFSQVLEKRLADFYGEPKKDPEAPKLRGCCWTQEEYDKAWVAQKGLCAICKKSEPLVADHKHAVPPSKRALLCNGCNRGLGFFLDNPDTCRAAADYLEAWV